MKKAWWSWELSSRPVDGTYGRFSYKELPPITIELDDEFKWLEKKHDTGCFLNDYTITQERLFQIEAQTNIKLPVSFYNFFINRDLQKRLHSYTSCYFTFPNYIVKTTGKYKGYLIAFLSDQQGGIKWYLYLDKKGRHFIVCSSNHYGFNSYEELYEKGLSNFSDKSEIDLEKEEIWFCGASFKEFI